MVHHGSPGRVAGHSVSAHYCSREQLGGWASTAQSCLGPNGNSVAHEASSMPLIGLMLPANAGDMMVTCPKCLCRASVPLRRWQHLAA